MPVDLQARLEWDIRVSIKSEYMKEMPFEGIDGRGAMALMWSFVDWRNETTDLLQKISHRSRAYFFNAHGLKGFLVTISATGLLKRAKALGVLEEVTRWQHIDYPQLDRQLKQIESSKG